MSLPAALFGSTGISRPVIRGLALLAIAAPIAFGQSATDADVRNQEPLKLDQLVVTGSVAPQSKLESALAVSTLDADQIQIAAPRSTAEMLKLIPGLYTAVLPRTFVASATYRF